MNPTPEEEGTNITPEILKPVLGNDPGKLREVLSCSGKELDTRLNDLFNGLRRWRLSDQFNPLQMGNALQTLRTVFISDAENSPPECRPIADAVRLCLETDIEPFANDATYLERKNRLLTNSQDPAIREIIDKMKSSGNTYYDHVKFTVSVPSGDKNLEFHIYCKNRRNQPKKDIFIVLGQSDTRLQLTISYKDLEEQGSESEPSLALVFPRERDAERLGDMSPPLRIGSIREEYEGMGETMLTLAMAVAVNEGAKTFLALDVPLKESGPFDNFFSGNSSGQFEREIQPDSLRTYRLDLMNLQRLPKIEIKKRTPQTAA